MTGGTFHVTIQAPPAAVWPWIAELEKHAEWSPHPYRVEWVSGEPNEVGSRYRSVGWVPGDSNHVNEGTILEKVPNERLRLDADDKEGTFHNTFVLSGSGGGTDVAFTLEFPAMKGMLALMAPAAFVFVGKRDIRKRMELLRQKVEGMAGA